MLSRVTSGAVMGIDAYVVDVEVDVTGRGLPFFSTVGLPDTAVKESRDRVRAALKNNGYDFPLKQIVVNLAPAGVRKEGAAFDLPIAVGIIASEGLIDQAMHDGYMIVGELSLDGRIKPVKGALPMAVKAAEGGMRGLILPVENAREAAVVEGIPVYGAARNSPERPWTCPGSSGRAAATPRTSPRSRARSTSSARSRSRRPGGTTY